MKKAIIKAGLILYYFLLASCSTCLIRGTDGVTGSIYPASTLNTIMIRCSIMGNCGGIFASGGTSLSLATLNVIDLPISLATDTLMLPLDSLSLLSNEAEQKEVKTSANQPMKADEK